jgi:hypothetical protein
MGRTKGSLGKKTLEKMKLEGKAVISENVAVTEPIKEDTEGYGISPDTQETRDTMVKAAKEHIEKIDGEESIAIAPKKKRGRKPGSKNKKTMEDKHEKQEFSSAEGSPSDNNTPSNYYKIAVESKIRLEKRLEKEHDPKLISAIKNSIYCNGINIERLRIIIGAGGGERVVGEDEVMSGEDID